MSGEQAYTVCDPPSDQPQAQPLRRRGDRRDLLRERSQAVAVTDSRLVFLGVDEQGALLEVMAIETDTGGLLIIHAQLIRARYLELLKGGL